MAAGGKKESSQSRESSGATSYLTGVGRGFGAAVIFSMPMLMTMEMWWLGFYMSRLRLAVFALLMVPVLIVLAHFVGIRPTGRSWTADVLDGMTGYGIGLVAAAAVLSLLGIITPEMPPREIIGKIAVLAVVASFGSMLGRSQLGSKEGKHEEEQRKQQSGYIGEIFFMLAGALYLALTVAATVEMIKVPFNMTEWHAVALVLISIALMHAFVYALEFKGAAATPEGTPWWSLFIRYSIPGYVVALGTSAYLLWTFGRFETFDLYWMLMYSVALGFPASVGAAAGRLLL